MKPLLRQAPPCLLLVVAAPASADRGDRMNNRFDRRGDRIDRRLDHRSARADERGFERCADRLRREGRPDGRTA